jgi:hypothetical protein
MEQGQQPERQVQVLTFPREELDRMVQNKGSLGCYISEHSRDLPYSRFDSAVWNLGSSAVDDLLRKIRSVGVSLTEFAGVKPYRGVLTGRNEAFWINTSTKDRLIHNDPRSAEIIKPCLRGEDIKRWASEWTGWWMIFARRGIDIDAYPAVKDYLLQLRERLEPRPKNWKGGEWLGRKPGSYQWYELQDAIDFWQMFEQPKIIWKDLSTYSEFCFDSNGILTNDLCFILTSDDKWLLAVLNSALMWYYLHHVAMHAINETLRLKNIYMEPLPIAVPNEAIRAEVEPAVERLITIKREQYPVRHLMLDWLRTEFDVKTPGVQLESFDTLDLAKFIELVRKRRSKSARKLTPAALKDLQAGYAEQIAPIQQSRTESAMLECKLNDLINTAYGFTPEEIALLWETAPPRMPLLPH